VSAPARPHDARLLALAISLGRRNLGLTWPNPSVGAVVVDETGRSPRILAAAATAPGGRPHAEPQALAQAGEGARGATLYVSLEPCSHHGRTPPCSNAVVSAGITRVVSALEDPDPRVTGRGHGRLRDAGLAVVTGTPGAAALRAHRGHFMRVLHGRPYLTVKLAQTPDGFAGRLDGRLLISGEETNARTHLMRARADAVMVGVATVLADDPRLSVRLPGLDARRPVRLVIDSRLATPSSSRLVRGAREQPVWIICTETAARADEFRLADDGVEVIRVGSTAVGRVNLSAALATLAERGLTSIFCEGGPRLAEALAEADLIDELIVITGRRRSGRRASRHLVRIWPAFAWTHRPPAAGNLAATSCNGGKGRFHVHWSRDGCGTRRS
jgi:diaminohydroxyphosphoribosylaminopyrimidine deaminase/5-amino-6-(5-phosphoribosylamino)uracil reductase